MRTLLAFAAALAVAAPAAAFEARSPYGQLAQAQTKKPSKQPDVIFVPTPQDVVEDMLRLANARKGDVLFDLGSGDGRIPITAAKKYGVRGVGIDIDPERIREATDNARREGVSNLVQFRQEDLFAADFSEATIVTLYLLPDLNVKLRPRLMEQLKPGTRILSHQFDMGTWKPEKKLESNGRVIYFWTIPKKKEGAK